MSHAVWRSFRFSLSYRDEDELCAARGVIVTHETIRQWYQTFEQPYANQVRRRRAQTGDTWHLDEVFIPMNGKQHDLWRAVDHHGSVLDIVVQSRRTTVAARTFFRKLRKGCPYVPRVSITDKRASYSGAKADRLPHVEHRQHKRRNNRIENAHQPTRIRARVLRRFTSPGPVQRFLAAHGFIRAHFCFGRHRYPANVYQMLRQEQFTTWHPIPGVIKLV